MESGAVISHITWKDGEFIRQVDGRIGNGEGQTLQECSFPYQVFDKGWFIVRKECQIHSYQAEQLLKAIPLHLEDPNRVWCYSGHEAEPIIAKAIRALYGEIKTKNVYIWEIERSLKSFANRILELEEENKNLRERLNHF